MGVISITYDHVINMNYDMALIRYTTIICINIFIQHLKIRVNYTRSIRCIAFDHQLQDKRAKERTSLPCYHKVQILYLFILIPLIISYLYCAEQKRLHTSTIRVEVDI